MCELFGASSSAPRGLFPWLGPFRQRGGEAADNPDGWGIAHWQDGDPKIEKSPEPGWCSAHFQRVSENLVSDLVIAHIRKARHPPIISLENTHPFVHLCCGRAWVFAHNGLVAEVFEHAAANPSCSPLGATDSEFAFCQLLAGIAKSYIQGDQQAWLTVLNRLADAIASLGKFNFLLSDGRILLAYGHDRLHYQESRVKAGHSVLVATEPLGDGSWQPFAPRELRVYQAGALVGSHRLERTVSERPTPASQEAASQVPGKCASV
jgi:glutamine amidotransferase